MKEKTTRATDTSSSRVQRQWSNTVAASRVFHGKTNLGPTVPSKADCARALQGLPPRPSLLAVSEAATLFQFRKVLPSRLDPREAFQSFKKRVTRPPRPLSKSFMDAVDSTLTLLPRNWDATYRKHVDLTVPKFTANLEGLSPTDLPITSADRFRDICLGLAPPIPIPALRRMNFVPDKDKLRGTTIPSLLQLQLAPLSATIYDALVSLGAVLRGPATPASMKEFTYSPGQVFVSADYQAATDNFEVSNTLYLITKLRSISTRIPSPLWDLLSDFMGPCLITSEYGSFTRTNGQLMGDRPSFPLLCLTNLVGVVLGLGLERTRLIIQRRLIRINGDDIVFRCYPREYHAWRSTLPTCGLLLETVKTLIHPRVLTLNSTFFMVRPSRRPRRVWFFPASSLLSQLRPRSPSEGLSPLFLGKQTETFLATLEGHIAPYGDSPATRRLRFHLLRSRPHHVRPIPATVPLPSPRIIKTLPPPWRKLLLGTHLFRQYRPEPHSIPIGHQPTRGFVRSLTAPKTPEARGFHRQITQYLQFNRSPLEHPPPILSPLPLSLSKPLGQPSFQSRYSFKGLTKWHPITPMTLTTHNRGIGFKPPDVFLKPLEPHDVPLPLSLSDRSMSSFTASVLCPILHRPY